MQRWRRAATGTRGALQPQPEANASPCTTCTRPSQDLRAKLLLLSDGDGQQLARLQEDNAELRRELAAQEHVMAELELKLQRAGIPTGGLGGLGSMALDAGMQRVTSMGLQAPAQQGSMGLPLTCGALPTLVSMPSQQQQQQQQQQLLQAPQVALAPQLAPGLTAAPMATATLGAVAQPTMSAADAVAQQQQQQMQVLAGMQTAAQVVVSMAPQAPAPPVQQVMLQAGNGLQAMAQPAATSMSSGALAAAAAAVHPALPARSGDALSGEAGMHAGLMQGTQPAHSGPTDPGAAVADAAAQNLNQQAQQLTVQATLHEQAKSAATSQAQQLASQAQLHAQASVQAAVQAEQLKQTLSVLPDNQQAQQAVATVQNLEERAKAHADITTQVRRGSGQAGRGRAGRDPPILACCWPAPTPVLTWPAALCPRNHPSHPAGSGAGSGAAGEGARARGRAGQGHGAGQRAAGARAQPGGVGAAD